MIKTNRLFISWGQRVFAYGLVVTGLITSITTAADLPAASSLKFKADGTFKIVAFGDIHWNGNTSEDQQTLQAMETILAAEAPDLVVYTGDNCTSSTLTTMRQGYQQFTAPVVQRGIPWAAMLGNHDAESGNFTRQAAYEATLGLPGNVSRPGPTNIHGFSNYVLPVMDTTGAHPEALLYVLDSNAYFRDATFDTYDWIHRDQIQWYQETSEACRQAYQKRLPACMFFHIPLPEINLHYAKGEVTGVEQEPPCPSEVNGGLWAALRENQDVIAVFNGHDHINDFIANLGGLWMGYVRGISYHTYGKEGYAKGSRVIQLHAGSQVVDTWLRLENGQALNPVQCGVTTPTNTTKLLGQWDFDQGDLRATVGNALEYARDDVRTGTHFGAATQFGVPAIDGSDPQIMQVPALSSMFGYIMKHGDPGNGQTVLQYTLLFDLLYPASAASSWRVLLQTDPANASDGDFFFNSSGGLGISSDYKGQIVANTWYRVGLVVDLVNSKVSKFINGEKVGEQSVGSRWALNSSTSSTPYALLFADDNGENAMTYVNSIQYWSGCLTDDNLAALGKPTAAGLPATVSAKIQLRATRQGDAIALDWTGGSAPFRVQSKPALDQPWVDAATLQTNRGLTNSIDAPAAFYRVLGGQ